MTSFVNRLKEKLELLDEDDKFVYGIVVGLFLVPAAIVMIVLGLVVYI